MKVQNMNALCRVMVIAVQATAFSMAKVPPMNFSPSSLTPIARSHSGSIDATKARSNTSLQLSPASVGGLLLRGGGGAAETAVLKNFYGDALGYFGGIRIPATFLAGSSLAAIFSIKSVARGLYSDKEDGKVTQCSAVERGVIKFYHLVSLFAFLFSLNTIIIATSAHTAILHGRFDHMAETAYLLMKREFEYEFVSVRLSFFASTFSFLGIVTSRMLIEFDLLKKTDKKIRKDVAMLVLCSVGALSTHLLSYINQNLWCWKSLFGMGAHFIKLNVNRAFVERRPLEILSVLLALMSAFYVGKLAIQDMKEGY